MKYRFNELLFVNYKNIRTSLIKIYGIGHKRSNYICDFFGIGFLLKIGKLNFQKFLILSWMIKFHYLVEDFLKKKKILSLRAIKETNGLKAIRHLNFLPVNGQRTHSNAKTRKKLKPKKLRK